MDKCGTAFIFNNYERHIDTISTFDNHFQIHVATLMIVMVLMKMGTKEGGSEEGGRIGRGSTGQRCSGGKCVFQVSVLCYSFAILSLHCGQYPKSCEISTEGKHRVVLFQC